MLKLEEILNGRTDSISFEEVISYDNEYLADTGVIELNNINVKGKLYRNSDEEVFIKMESVGEMLIEDSVSLKPVLYPFSISIDEKIEGFLEKSENTIDIMEFLWQNIVLEIPLRYTIVDDLSKYQGKDWKLISEEELKKNNPFSTLLDSKEEE